jgi:hypothetical protein
MKEDVGEREGVVEMVMTGWGMLEVFGSQRKPNSFALAMSSAL